MADEEKKASIVEVKKFLQDTENPPNTEEFTQFWMSLTDEEKEEYKSSLP